MSNKMEAQLGAQKRINKALSKNNADLNQKIIELQREIAALEEQLDFFKAEAQRRGYVIRSK